MSKLVLHNRTKDPGPPNYEGLNMKLIVCVAAVIISMSTSYANESSVGVENPSDLSFTPLLILQKWPICSFSSSLGQTCRTNWGNKAPNGILEVIISQFAEDATTRLQIEISNTKLEITIEDEWYYSFEVSPLGDRQYSVIFTDDALAGTYLSQTEYSVSLNEGIIFINEGATETW